MRCMKCGREIKERQVFCGDCLAEMEKYPVSPNTTVRLPVRRVSTTVKKKSRRNWDSKPEDQIRHMRLLIRCLCVALAVTLAAFALVATLLLHMIDQREQNPDVDPNYSYSSWDIF